MSGQASLPSDFNEFLKRVRERDDPGGQESMARSALTELCRRGEEKQKGFDPKTLAFHLRMLCIVQDAVTSGQPLKPLQYGEKATEHFTLREVPRIAKLARKLRDYVRDLKLTNLVFEAHMAGRIQQGDLLSEPFPDKDVVALKTLMALPKLAHWYTKTHLPSGTDHRLWTLCQFIKDTTGKWNDSLVVDLLDPLAVRHCKSVEELKQWRYNLGKKVTRRSQKTPV